jgi:hypothetical protein
LVRLIRLALVAGGLLLPAVPAAAAPVTVYDGGRLVRENDPFVPSAGGPAPTRKDGARATARAAGNGSVRGALGGLLAAGQIGQVEHDERVKEYDDALAIRNQLSGARRRELSGVISLVTGIAGRGELSASRLRVLWTQLNRNAEFWAFSERFPANGERIRFRGSRVLYQYFPGQGLQFHPLANWGRASGLLAGGFNENAREFLAELLPMASTRGDALTWEYFFWFGGGRPPWTSGLSQGTALVALVRAYRQLGDADYLDTARRALAIYTLRTPTGVRVPTRYGAHYAEYSFAPRLRIINGFIQALNGLWDVRTYSSLARELFQSGDRQARRELPRFDTGRWSRYSNSRGSISPLNYHVLLTDFLTDLCRRTGIGIYCSKAARFRAYMRRGPPRRNR